MKSWIKIKFLPFSSGIPWQFKNSRYVIPKLDKTIWDRVVSDKDLVVACYGGLIESFFSLSYIEALKKIYPQKSIAWLGYPKFYDLAKAQDLATISNLDITKTDLEDYPVPLFFTKKNHAIFNCLNNYLIKQTYYKKKNFKRHELIFKQLAENLLIDWDIKYTPKIRNLNSYTLKQKYILIFPDDFGSLHNINCLDWSVREVRELAAMVSRLSYKVVVVCSKENSRKYFGHTNLITVSMNDLLAVLQYVTHARIILSKNIDYLLLASLLSKSKIISSIVPKQLDLLKNSLFCSLEPDICILKDDILPIDVYNFCNKEGKWTNDVI